MLFRITPLIIAAVLLAAHFLRSGNLLLLALCLLTPFLLLVKKRWSLILLQLLAYAGTAIWIRTTVQIVQERLALGRPWGRVVIILGVVILVTALAGLLLNSNAVKQRYPP